MRLPEPATAEGTEPAPRVPRASRPASGTRAPKNREEYIDAFRGLMALVMVQGHLFDTLLTAGHRSDPLYQWEQIFHGSTAPGFLFASGFVAGLPRAPLSLKASVRRTRRLLFVLGVGYALHLPYFSLWKTALQATPAELAAFLACDALQVIAVSQLFVMLIQSLWPRRWAAASAVAAAVMLAVSPEIWASGLSARLPLWLGQYLDANRGSTFPVFPYAAFVLAGTVAGTTLGRAQPEVRHRRIVSVGLALLAVGALISWLFRDQLGFWGAAPGYVLLRLGALVLLLRLAEIGARRGFPGTHVLALLGRETLLVYVLHLMLLYGGVLGTAPLAPYVGQMDFRGAALVFLGMLPILWASTWTWNRVKGRSPHGASAVLALLTVWFTWELLMRPW